MARSLRHRRPDAFRLRRQARHLVLRWCRRFGRQRCFLRRLGPFRFAERRTPERRRLRHRKRPSKLRHVRTRLQESIAGQLPRRHLLRERPMHRRFRRMHPPNGWFQDLRRLLPDHRGNVRAGRLPRGSRHVDGLAASGSFVLREPERRRRARASTADAISRSCGDPTEASTSRSFDVVARTLIRPDSE